MSEPASSKRPPVPSAEESARAGWIAPLVAIALNVYIVKSSPDPTVKFVVSGLCCLIVLIGLAASIWGFYVASFFGPRKHILPAIVGFSINACFIGALILVIQATARMKAEHDQAVPDAPAVAQAPESTPGRY